MGSFNQARKVNNEPNLFFAPNKEFAKNYIDRLAERDKFYRGRKVKLAKRQIHHISGWKTWRHFK